MKWLVILLAAVFTVVAGGYLLNPFGTATLDPRGRLVGYVPYTVRSSSMAPTIQPGDTILVQTSAYAASDPRVGDVIAFFPPESQGPNARVYRVVGTSGDRLRIVGGRLDRNDSPVHEPFAGEWKMPYALAMDEITVPASVEPFP